DGSNPLYGLAISKIIVDPGPGTPAARLYVATSDQVANLPVPTAATPEIPGVYRFDTSTRQVQTITLPTRSGSGTFTLTFEGKTTVPLHYNSPTLAMDIQVALNNLSTIGGPGAAAVIAGSPNGASEAG